MMMMMMMMMILLLFIYLFAQAHTLRTIRQGLEQESKAQTCTDSYPKITGYPTQYKSKIKSKQNQKYKSQITN